MKRERIITCARTSTSSFISVTRADGGFITGAWSLPPSSCVDSGVLLVLSFLSSHHLGNKHGCLCLLRFPWGCRTEPRQDSAKKSRRDCGDAFYL